VRISSSPSVGTAQPKKNAQHELLGSTGLRLRSSSFARVKPERGSSGGSASLRRVNRKSDL
jgi:hypothetical protein